MSIFKGQINYLNKTKFGKFTYILKFHINKIKTLFRLWV